MSDEQLIRILFVEDAPYDAELAERVLRKEGLIFTSTRVETQDDFLAALTTFQPDLIVSDYTMPAFDGIRALRLSLENDAARPFIVLTGTQNEETAVACIKAGATDYVLKDRLARLPFAVKEALAQTHARLAKETAERALRESEDRYRDLVENSHDLICTHSLDGKLLSVNEAAVRLTGYSRVDLLQMNMIDLLTPPAQRAFSTYLRKIRTRGYARGLMHVKTARGETRIWEYDNTLRTEGLAVSVVRGIAHDVTERIRAEEALRESEKNYQALTEISPVGVFRTDARGTTTYVNPRWCQISGLTAEEALGDGWLHAVPVEDREKISANWQEAIDAQLASMSEYRFVRPDGSVAWVLGQAIPEKNTQHQIIGYVGTITDITELKVAQKRLAASEAELRALFAAMHDVVLVIDGDGVYREIAPTNPHLLYKPRAELLGESLMAVFPPFEADQFLSATREVLTTGQSKQIEYQLRINEVLHWFSTNITPMTDELAVWVAHDITDRKQIADEIRRLKEFDETLIDNMSEGIVVQDAAGYFTFVNPAVVDITGYLPQELLGEHWTRFVPADHHDRVRMADARRLDGEASRYEVDFLHKNGPRINLLISGNPLFENGRFIGSMAVFTDITDRKRTEDAIHQLNAELEQRVIERTRELAVANERLQELDRLKSKFVSDVSHELRTPVTTLSLYVDLLERGKPEKREFYVTQLRQQMARLRTLINEILDLARLERDQHEASLTQIDLNSIVEHVVATQQAVAEAAGLQLTCKVAEPLPLVLAQPEQLNRAITNLLANAIKYTRAGSVQVKTEASDGRVCVVVADTGIGIASEDLPHLFERFYRGKQVAQSTLPGTGLGLAIVKEIAQAHGGTVDVESRLAAGSTFRLWLPTAAS